MNFIVLPDSVIMDTARPTNINTAEHFLSVTSCLDSYAPKAFSVDVFTALVTCLQHSLVSTVYYTECSWKTIFTLTLLLSGYQFSLDSMNYIT